MFECQWIGLYCSIQIHYHCIDQAQCFECMHYTFHGGNFKLNTSCCNNFVRLMLLLTTWTFGKLFNKIQVPWRHAAMLTKAQEVCTQIAQYLLHMDHQLNLFFFFFFFFFSERTSNGVPPGPQEPSGLHSCHLHSLATGSSCSSHCSGRKPSHPSCIVSPLIPWHVCKGSIIVCALLVY